MFTEVEQGIEFHRFTGRKTGFLRNFACPGVIYLDEKKTLNQRRIQSENSIPNITPENLSLLCVAGLSLVQHNGSFSASNAGQMEY